MGIDVRNFMVGDFAIRHHGSMLGRNSYDEIVKVTGSDIACEGLELEGIPITKEFLDENGFTEEEWEFYDGYNFELHNVRDCVSVGPIWFVHELQHALRLANLDERADNLKGMKIWKLKTM